MFWYSELPDSPLCATSCRCLGYSLWYTIHGILHFCPQFLEQFKIFLFVSVQNFMNFLTWGDLSLSKCSILQKIRLSLQWQSSSAVVQSTASWSIFQPFPSIAWLRMFQISHSLLYLLLPLQDIGFCFWFSSKYFYLLSVLLCYACWYNSFTNAFIQIQRKSDFQQYMVQNPSHTIFIWPIYQCWEWWIMQCKGWHHLQLAATEMMRVSSQKEANFQ